MSQHAALTIERWSGFSLAQQILMIANEMHRASKLLSPEHRARRDHSYERVLQLTDLTISLSSRRSFRRELLRWRDLVAERYVTAESEVDEHRRILRALLQLHPEAAAQIEHVGA